MFGDQRLLALDILTELTGHHVKALLKLRFILDLEGLNCSEVRLPFCRSSWRSVFSVLMKLSCRCVLAAKIFFVDIKAGFAANDVALTEKTSAGEQTLEERRQGLEKEYLRRQNDLQDSFISTEKHSAKTLCKRKAYFGNSFKSLRSK